MMRNEFPAADIRFLPRKVFSHLESSLSIDSFIADASRLIRNTIRFESKEMGRHTGGTAYKTIKQRVTLTLKMPHLRGINALQLYYFFFYLIFFFSYVSISLQYNSSFPLYGTDR